MFYFIGLCHNQNILLKKSQSIISYVENDDFFYKIKIQ